MRTSHFCKIEYVLHPTVSPRASLPCLCDSFHFFGNLRLSTQFLTSNMANMEQQMHPMFIHLGLSQAIATSIINDHGIVTLTNLLHFEPSDIDALCKNIQHPSGTITGYNNQQVPNPGMPISTMAQSNLKLATFWIMHHLERV